MTFMGYMLWLIVICIVGQTIDKVFFRGKSETEKALNTRVSNSGPRLGAWIDAQYQKAQGRKPTNYY